MFLYDGFFISFISKDKDSPNSQTEGKSPIHKSSIAVAMADSIQLAAQPVSHGKAKKMAPVDRAFHDIIDAECVFIELADQDADEIDGAEGRDPADGR